MDILGSDIYYNLKTNYEGIYTKIIGDKTNLNKFLFGWIYL